MPITKRDLTNLRKSIVADISKFLEDHVINKLFKLEEDMKKLKHDVEQIDRKLEKSIERADRHGADLEDQEKRITTLEKSKFA